MGIVALLHLITIRQEARRFQSGAGNTLDYGRCWRQTDVRPIFPVRGAAGEFSRGQRSSMNILIE